MLRKLFQYTNVVVVLALAVLITLTLWTYDPNDPSLDAASHQAPQNALGLPGAYMSDILIQYFGLCALVPVIVLILWCVRFIRHSPQTTLQDVKFFLIYGSSACVFLFLLTGVVTEFFRLFSRWLNPQMSWPGSESGPGGAIGDLLATTFQGIGTNLLPNSSPLAVGYGVFMLSLGLTGFALLFTLALTREEYYAFGQHVVHFGGQLVRLPVLVVVFLLRSFYYSICSLPRRGKPAAAGPAPWAQAAVPAQGGGHVVDETPDSASSSGDYTLANMASGGHDDVTKDTHSSVTEIDPVEEGQIEESHEESTPQKPSKPSIFNPARFLPSLHQKKEESLVPQKSATRALTTQEWQYPPLSLLTPPPQQDTVGASQEEMAAVAEHIVKILRDFGVKGRITGFRTGPVVTLYEFEPEDGVRINRVVGLADDLARPLCVTSVRVAPIPRSPVIGIEVPNTHRKTVYLSELFSLPAWTQTKQHLPMALGQNIMGEAVIVDLAKMPHLLVAGTTGSGKSVGVNAMILSLLNKLSPAQCRLILIDPKMLEFSLYEDIPHLLTPVITEAGKAINALKWLVRDMDQRYEKMSKMKVRDIVGYNERLEALRQSGEQLSQEVITGYDEEKRPIKQEKPLNFEPLPYIVVIIDEAAELMIVAGKEVKECIKRLCQKARAAGIHIIMATQRPSVDVIDGVIKANFPARIAFQVGQKVDSRTILGQGGAERLLGRGDMLFMESGGVITRVHGPFVSDGEVERTVEFLKEEGEPDYQDDVTCSEAEMTDEDDGEDKGKRQDDRYEEAKELVISKNKASPSFLQSYMQIGWSRASRLIAWMEQDGIVSDSNGSGKRRVLVTPSSSQEAPDIHGEPQ